MKSILFFSTSVLLMAVTFLLQSFDSTRNALPNDHSITLLPASEWTGVMITFYRIDNKVRITKYFNNTKVDIWESNHYDNDPALSIQRQLVNAGDQKGQYEFRIEILNEHDKGHFNPWNLSAQVFATKGLHIKADSDKNQRLITLNSQGRSEHGNVVFVGSILVNKQWQTTN